jgi:hypothetical protein
MTSLLRWFRPWTTTTAPPSTHQTNETQQQQEQQRKQADLYTPPPKTIEEEGQDDDDDAVADVDDRFYGADDFSRPWYKKVEYNILLWTTVVILIGTIVGVSVGVSNSNQSYEPQYFPPPPSPPSPPPPGPDPLPPPLLPALLPAPVPSPEYDYESDLQFSMFSSESNKKNSDNFTKSTAICVGGTFITRWDLYYEEPPRKTTQGMETPISGLKIECNDGSTFDILVPPDTTKTTTGQFRTAQNRGGFDQIEGRYGDYIDWIFVQSSAADGPKFSFTYTCAEPGEKVNAVQVMYNIEQWGDEDEDGGGDNEKALMREIGFLCTGNNNNGSSSTDGGGEIEAVQVETEDTCSPWVGLPVQGRNAILYRAKPLVCPCGEVATGLQSWAYTDKTAITSIRVQCSNGSSVPPWPEQSQPATREVSWGEGGTSVLSNIAWGPDFVRSIGGEGSPLEEKEEEGYSGVEMVDTVTCGGGTGGQVLGVVVLSRGGSVDPIPRLQVVCGSAENCFEYQTEDGCLTGF